jgi:hypothetical protein
LNATKVAFVWLAEDDITAIPLGSRVVQSSDGRYTLVHTPDGDLRLLWHHSSTVVKVPKESQQDLLDLYFSDEKTVTVILDK